jgi:glycosyltransferase involved in cell wall biosynthesis
LILHNPLVSIIVPTFNRADLIKSTLDSVIAQTYGDWECILVDDQSTDETFGILEAYARRDKRIKVFGRVHKPKGAPACRNVGLKEASGDLIIYLDSDDLLAPYSLSQRVNLFTKYPQNDFIVFNAFLFNETPGDAEFLWNEENDEQDIDRFLRLDALWQTTGPIYKKSFLIEMKGFREDLLFWQDFDLHLRCLFSGALYKKFLTMSPDYYIRTGRKDTISRSTAFTANATILNMRISYYCELAYLISKLPISDRRRSGKIVNSVLFYFCCQHLMRFSNAGEFISRWKQAQKLGLENGVSTSLSALYGFVLKLSFRIKIFSGLSALYRRLFFKRLPDYFVLDKNRMCRVKKGKSVGNFTAPL